MLSNISSAELDSFRRTIQTEWITPELLDQKYNEVMLKLKKVNPKLAETVSLFILPSMMIDPFYFRGVMLGTFTMLYLMLRHEEITEMEEQFS